MLLACSSASILAAPTCLRLLTRTQAASALASSDSCLAEDGGLDGLSEMNALEDAIIRKQILQPGVLWPEAFDILKVQAPRSSAQQHDWIEQLFTCKKDLLIVLLSFLGVVSSWFNLASHAIFLNYVMLAASVSSPPVILLLHLTCSTSLALLIHFNGIYAATTAQKSLAFPTKQLLSTHISRHCNDFGCLHLIHFSASPYDSSSAEFRMAAHHIPDSAGSDTDSLLY